VAGFLIVVKKSINYVKIIGTQVMVASQQKRTTKKANSSANTSTTTSTSTSIPQNSAEAIHGAGFTEVFTSHTMKGIVLMMIVAFNVVVLKNSFLLTAPKSGFSGDIQLDALLYGIGISTLMVIVLFHEERWEDALCPGAITLYLDALILVLYTNWFGWLIGSWWTLWVMSGLMISLPVVGLFIMVVMLKK
jgi:hypothetical protein